MCLRVHRCLSERHQFILLTNFLPKTFHLFGYTVFSVSKSTSYSAFLSVISCPFLVTITGLNASSYSKYDLLDLNLCCKFVIFNNIFFLACRKVGSLKYLEKVIQKLDLLI